MQSEADDVGTTTFCKPEPQFRSALGTLFLTASRLFSSVPWISPEANRRHAELCEAAAAAANAASTAVAAESTGIISDDGDGSDIDTDLLELPDDLRKRAKHIQSRVWEFEDQLQADGFAFDLLGCGGERQKVAGEGSPVQNFSRIWHSR